MEEAGCVGLAKKGDRQILSLDEQTSNQKFLQGVQGGSFFKKGGGTPNLFTVSLMPFFRSFISKVCRKNKVSQGISKKRPPGRRRQIKINNHIAIKAQLC
jgi:hypothetical protein